MKRVRIGCSGWNYKDWREAFYPKGMPPGDWLRYYAKTFDTVEINNTFYRLPKQSAVENWVEQTPKGFAFAVKSGRYLTHIKRLQELDTRLPTFYERIEPLAVTPKMGPLLWQLPANFKRDDERLRGALEQLPRGRHCFEFRHPSWFCDEVYALLRRHRAALVIGDTPERKFQTYELTASWTFIRFHHGTRGRDGNYSARELEEWAERIRGFGDHAEVYAYFNNDWKAYAVKNAVALKELLGA
jgi:uncharacterized protein YecE (DUF72 family)